ncbi:unnamed protein product [Sphagnum balticum]
MDPDLDAEASRLPSQPLSGVDAIDHLISLQARRAPSRRWLLEDVLTRRRLVNLNGNAALLKRCAESSLAIRRCPNTASTG